jgi:hypothetical protein
METARKRAGAAPVDLDRFVSEQNVARYRKLLDARTDENERRIIVRQLADEMAKLRDTARTDCPEIENPIRLAAYSAHR